MTTVRVPDKGIQLTDTGEIIRFLQARGIRYQHRSADLFHADGTDSDVLYGNNSWLRPFMEQHSYRTADGIRVTPETPNLPAIRDKFLREHMHSEDEVRFFVEGEGLFWFHTDTPDSDVFSVRCTAGDLLAVPANTKHWFDLGPEPRVCAIRIFTDQAGWIPQYTHSGIEQRYRMALHGILLDIEGTILPKSYVTEVLFPYARKHLAAYLHAHQNDQEVRRWASMCQETIAKESGRWLSYDDMAGILTQWMTGDRKHQGLKALQGLIWEEGYRTGVFAPHLYEDVVPALRRWRQERLQLAIYSSGSEQAQRLLLEHTTEGNLTPMFSRFFDTGMGSKLEPASYGRIADSLEYQPMDVLFLSDAERELNAAATAGFLTTQVVRPGTDRTTRHPTVSTLDDLIDFDSLFTESAFPLIPPVESQDVI